jgi:spore maturation protein CgeB
MPSGRLVTFAFTPLAAYEAASKETVLITGIPRYAAIEHAVTRFDPVDAARAAEQLAEAQDHAARLEAAAIERAVEELANEDEARELVAETRSTGEALRDITGQ